MFASLFYRAYLNPGEKIVYVAHVHPITVYGPFMKNFIFGLALPGFFYLLMPPFVFLWAGWAIIAVFKLLLLVADWYFDALLITNQSLIDIEWKGIFKRSSTRIEYHTIEGVSYEIVGFWGTVLNFGDITIERIGSGKVFGLKDVGFPKQAEREILNAQNEFVRNKSFRDHKALKDLLTNMMQDYSNFN